MLNLIEWIWIEFDQLQHCFTSSKTHLKTHTLKTPGSDLTRKRVRGGQTHFGVRPTRNPGQTDPGMGLATWLSDPGVFRVHLRKYFPYFSTAFIFSDVTIFLIKNIGAFISLLDINIVMFETLGWKMYHNSITFITYGYIHAVQQHKHNVFFIVFLWRINVNSWYCLHDYLKLMRFINICHISNTLRTCIIKGKRQINVSAYNVVS